jgi:hypothetical protein
VVVPTHDVDVTVVEDGLVAEISACVHAGYFCDGQGVNVDVVGLKAKPLITASTQDNDTIFGGHRRGVSEWHPQLDIDNLPPVSAFLIYLDTLDLLESVESSHHPNPIFDNGCCEGAPEHIHGGDVLPLVFVDIVDFAACHALILIVEARQSVHEAVHIDTRVLLPARYHAPLVN